MTIIKMIKSLLKRVPICQYPAYWIGHRSLDWLLSEQWSESVPCLDLPIRRNSLWRCLFIFDPPLYLWAGLETNRKCWKRKKLRESQVWVKDVNISNARKRKKVRKSGGWWVVGGSHLSMPNCLARSSSYVRHAIAKTFPLFQFPNVGLQNIFLLGTYWKISTFKILFTFEWRMQNLKGHQVKSRSSFVNIYRSRTALSTKISTYIPEIGQKEKNCFW